MLFSEAAYTQSDFTKDNFKFEHFTLPGGVLTNQVQQVVQDSSGFLWFATKGGLIKYDGRAFKIFEANPLDTSVHKTNYIERLLIDKEEMLWIGTYGGGLSKMNPHTGAYLPVNLKFAADSIRLNRYIYALLEDRFGHIWVGTSNGLYQINPNTLVTQFFSADTPNPNALHDPIIWNLYEDRAGTIWVGTGFPWEYQPSRGGLHRYNPTSNDFTRFLHDPNDPTSISDNRVRAIYEDSNNNFWVGSMGNSLDLMNRAQGTFQRFTADSPYDIKITKPKVRASNFTLGDFSQTTFVHEDAFGYLWVGAFNGGLNIYNPKSQQQLHFEAEEETTNGMTTNFLFDIFETKDRTIFLCSGDGGDNTVTKVTYSTNLFTTHFLPKKDTKRGFIQNIIEDENGNIWLGTLNGEGLFQWDVDHHTIATHPTYLKSKNVISVSHTGDGKIWLGYTDNGYEVIDATTKALLPSPFPIDLTKKLAQTSINAAFKDSKGNYWLPTRFEGVYKLNTDQSVIHFADQATSKNAPTIGGATIDRIVEDEQGFIWLFGAHKTWDGIYSMTIDRYNPIEQTIEPILKSNELNGYASSIARDKAGNFWFPDGLDGIKKLDIQTHQITTINTSNSRIPSDEIRALTVDNRDIIWVTTKNKIAAYNPLNQSFRVFDDLDGVNLELSFGAICKRKNGQLLFGGKNGFLEIDPKVVEWKEQFAKPTIRITELTVNNNLITNKNSLLNQQPIWDKTHLHLNHQQNNFSLGLSNLDFQSSDNYIEYYLENYDRNWRKAGPEQLATYVNVPPGNYTFKTRGANAKGGWNPNGQSININISKPWWQTWWAFLLATLAFLFLIFTVYQFQLNRQKIKQEAKNLKDLDALKTKLYANITHEFRTPLTLILGLAQQIKNHSLPTTITNKAATIEKNGQELLFLVNQLLDLRKLEAGQAEVNYQQGDVLPLFHYYSDNFASMAESRDILMEKNFPNAPIVMDYDADYLHKIAVNLLSNALKFTENGGKVNFKIESTKDQLVLQIKDNGIGIPSHQLPHIFDRFYRSESAKNYNGTGIGLALTKELVQLLKGTIEVQSVPDIGSKFTVTLPIQRTAKIVDKTNLSKGFSSPIEINNAPLESWQNSADSPIILIVEDNKAVAQFTASCLKNGYTIHFAQDGQEGINKAIEIIPDLIISDVTMPQKDGFELCETLKTDEKTSHIPIILLTARAAIKDRIAGLKRGADAYLSKPFYEQELTTRIEQLIAQRAMLKTRYADLTLQQPSSDAALKIEDEFVLKIRALIEENLDNEDFGVHDISKAIFLSRAQVHRKLKALTNKSTGQFIRTVRLHHALGYLQNTNKTITEIAYAVGFKDPAYFSRVFAEEFGTPPSKMKV